MVVLTLLKNLYIIIFFSFFQLFFKQLVIVTAMGVFWIFWSMGHFQTVYQTVDKIFWFIWWVPETNQNFFKEDWDNSVSYWIVSILIMLVIWFVLAVVCWIAVKFAVSGVLLFSTFSNLSLCCFGYYY